MLKDYLYINPSIYDFESLIKILKINKPKYAIYSNQTEYFQTWYIDYLNYKSEPKQLNQEFLDVLIEYDIKFYLIVGAEYNEVFSHFKTHPIKNFEVVYWPTYLAYHCLSHFKKSYAHQNYRINTDFKHLFICYNNKPRYHRCELMDQLCERNLLDGNLYSWIENRNMGFPHTKEKLVDEVYNFRCFENLPTKIDNFDVIKTKEFTDNLFDMKCFINIVSESDINALFITEKTYRQILIGQPFIVVGAKDFHKTLENYGFKLYDEIIDYSFDSESDFKLRIKGVVDNIEKLNGQDYQILYDKIKDKVEYNVNLIYKIINESYLTPEFIIKLCKEVYVNKEKVSMLDCQDTLFRIRDKVYEKVYIS